MKESHTLALLLSLLISSVAIGQQASITYQLNGRTSNQGLEKIAGAKPKNPFAKFIGEWTLKNDEWNQNWGGGKETIKIPKHHTICSEVNTDLSLLSIIDGPQPNGHIFWSLDAGSNTFHHLSSFGTARAGVGEGSINEKGDLSINVSFTDEAKGTYRLYTYTWVNSNEYELMSIQYDTNGKPTGLFYGGTFVRISK